MARSIVEVALVVWAAGVKAPGGLEARWSGSQPPPTDRGPAYVTEQGGRQRVRSRKVSSNDCPSGSTTGRLPCTQSRLNRSREVARPASVALTVAKCNPRRLNPFCVKRMKQWERQRILNRKRGFGPLLDVCDRCVEQSCMRLPRKLSLNVCARVIEVKHA